MLLYRFRTLCNARLESAAGLQNPDAILDRKIWSNSCLQNAILARGDSVKKLLASPRHRKCGYIMNFCTSFKTRAITALSGASDVHSLQNLEAEKAEAKAACLLSVLPLSLRGGGHPRHLRGEAAS